MEPTGERERERLRRLASPGIGDLDLPLRSGEARLRLQPCTILCHMMPAQNQAASKALILL